MLLRQVVGVSFFTGRGSVRQPLLYVLLLITPLSYFVVLGLLGGRSLGREALLGAVVALGVNSGIISLPQVVVGLRDRKLQEMFVASPISPLTYGAGIAMSRLMYVAAPLVVVTVLVSLVGGLSGAQVALLLPLAVAGWVVGSTIGYVLALRWTNAMTVSSVSNMAGLLMTVFPPVYYPLALLPQPLHLPALLVPSANVAELLRLSLGLATADPWRVSAQVAYLLVSLVLAATLIRRKLQWEVA